MSKREKDESKRIHNEYVKLRKAENNIKNMFSEVKKLLEKGNEEYMFEKNKANIG